jgi:hypothetical protein
MAKSSYYDRDLGFSKLMTVFKTNNKESAVFVGFLRSSGIHKSKGKKPMTVAQIAAINEYGTDTIPERPYFRSTLTRVKTQIEKLMEKISLQVMEGALSRSKGLGVLGEFLKGEIVKTINQGVPPPNAASTIAQKKSSKTLIDSGQMKNAIDWEVQDGKAK